MPVKPKITRLSDPANPYNVKKIPTGRPQDKPKPSRVQAEPLRARATTGPAKTKAQSFMQGLNDKYGGGARKRALDSQIDAASGDGKKKK